MRLAPARAASRKLSAPVVGKLTAVLPLTIAGKPAQVRFAASQ